MASRKLDGVHSLNSYIEKQSQEAVQSRNKVTKTKAKVEKVFDARAPDSDDDDESSNSDSDDGSATDKPLAIVNGQIASSPAKKTKRGKDDEVADSDAERKANAAKFTATKKATVRPESSSDESSSDAEADDSDSDSSDSESESSKKPAPKVTKKDATSNGTSSTSTSGSDSDSESEAETTSKPAAKPAVNGTKSTKSVKPASTSSSAGSSSDSSSSSEEGSSESDSSDKESSEKDSSSDEESEDEAVEKPVAVARRNSKELSVPGFVGKDFILRQAQGDEDGKDMADFFAKAKQDGKQLWYFTVPAAIPINVIEKLEMPMDKVKKGETIFKHNSEDYTADYDGEGSTSIVVMIPSKKGARYESAPQKLVKVLQVKRVLQSRPAGRALANQQDAARPQPQGLRARFRPIGVTDDTPMGSIGVDASSDGEDVEMTAAPAASSSKKSKRAAPTQHDAMDIDEPTPKSSKKAKKKSKAARDPVQDSQSSIIEVPNSQPLPSKEKKGKKRRGSIESISSVGSNPKPELLKGQKGAVATPDQPKKASKRKHSSEDDQESASAQLQKETASAEKKSKKVKRDDSSDAQASKKQTAIPPPTVPKANYSFSGLGSSPAPASTPLQTKSKGSKKSKETPVQPPSVRRESAVPLPQHMKQASPAAAETPKKEKRKRRKSDKAEDPKSDKKETPVPVPNLKF